MDTIKTILSYIFYASMVFVFMLVLSTKYVSTNVVKTIKSKSDGVIYHDICNEGDIYTLYTLDTLGNWKVYDFLYKNEAEILDKHFKK